MGQQFGDTTFTKVFVGGLAWETQKDTLGEYFDKFGEILEAVIISDKATGRSKGYGFVTFKDAEAAKKACEDATPVINGRRANCNLASLGAKRNGNGFQPSPPTTPAPLPSAHHHPPGMTMGTRGLPSGPQAPWYYHPSGTPPPVPAAYHHHYPGVVPYYATGGAAYGYSPNYMTDLSYTSKVGHNGGGYYQGQFSYAAAAAAQGGMIAPNAMMPMYPLYHFHNQHQATQGMTVPAHFFSPASSIGMTTIPTIISKPPTITPPPTAYVAVEQAAGCS